MPTATPATPATTATPANPANPATPATPTLEAALAYARAGFPVFPCDPESKAPLTRHGFHDATTDHDTLIRWFGFDPQRLIGLPVPPGHFVVDFDTPDGPTGWNIDDPLVAKTPHGWHYYFRGEHNTNSKGALTIDGDVRGHGAGYVIAAPSQGYFWWGASILDQPAPTAPDWLMQALASTSNYPEPTTTPINLQYYPLQDRIQLAKEKLQEHGPAVERVRGGCHCCSGGDEHTAKAAFIVVNDCAVDDPAIAREILYDWNNACDPPWDHETLDRKVYNAQKNAQADYGRSLIRLWSRRLFRTTTARGKAQTIFESLPDTPSRKKAAFEAAPTKKEQSQILQEIARLEDDQALATLQQTDGFAPDIQHGDAAQLAKELARSYQSADGTPVASEWGRIYRYNPNQGVWQEIPRSRLSHRLASWSGLLKEDGKPLHVTSPANAIDLLLDWPVEFGQGEGWLADAPTGLAFTDAFVAVDPETHTLHAKQHHPDNRATAGYPFAIQNPNPPRLFQDYLHSLWPVDPEPAMLLQEFLGAALFGLAPRYHKALVLHGPAGTGKSTFLRIVEGLFPAGTVSHVDPQKFDNDNHLGTMIGARLNTVHELPSKHIQGLERIKTVIDGAPTPLDQKYQRSINFAPIAAHLFAANNLPQIADVHPSFWDRFVILELTNRFRDTADEDPDLSKKILAHELPGVVAWAIEGAERLLDNDAFTIPTQSRRAMEKWQRSANATGIFVEEWCLPAENPTQWTPASDLVQSFARFCRLNGHKQPSSRTFGLHLSQLPGVERKHTNRGNTYNLRVVSDPLNPVTGEPN